MNCAHCTVPFAPKRVDSRFCSRRCRDAYRAARVTKVCVVCGNEHHRAYAITCSPRCHRLYVSETSKKHGMTDSPTYTTWSAMLMRCNNPNREKYAAYGGRGIKVTARWDPQYGGSFENFLTDMGERPEGMTLDRIDVNGNYEPSNCKWATGEEQNANKRKKGDT